MPSTVIVDEQDPRVVYTGQWDSLTDPVQFRGVSTGSKIAGSTCSFNFTGTSITVAATIMRAGPPHVQFTLDGVSFPSSATFSGIGNDTRSYNPAAFSADNLSNDQHSLIIKTTDTTPEVNLFLDYFLYTTSPKTDMNGKTLLIDDRDEGITYAGNWRSAVSDFDFRRTSRAADNTTSTSISIPFNGTNIQFYAVIEGGAPGSAPLAQFVLDGTKTTTFTSPGQTSDLTWNNRLYDSGLLPQGSHTLVITPKSQQTLRFDYALAQQGTTLAATSATPTATRAPSPSPTSTKPALISSTVIGIIVGVSLLIFAAVAFFIFKFWRRRHPHGYGAPRQYPSYRQAKDPELMSLDELSPTQESTTHLNPPPLALMGQASDAVIIAQAREYEDLRRKRPRGPSQLSPPINHIDSGLRMLEHEFPPVYTVD